MNTLVLLTGGLNPVYMKLVQNWIGPLFLLIIAGLSLKFMISRQFRELAGFLAIGAIVAIMIYGTGNVFGENGLLTNIAKGFANLIQPETGGSAPGAGSGPGNTINFMRLFFR